MKPPDILLILKRTSAYLAERKYECLLVSFLLLIFGNTFTTSRPIIGIIDIYQNFIAGLLIFYTKRWLRYFILCILFVTIVLDVFENQLLFLSIISWHGYLYLLFFFAIAKEVLYTKTVTRELLAAALCGFVLLCLISTFLFYLIDLEQPHSFTNTVEGKAVLTNLNYFSFTTLLTIGFGDITPVTIVAKRAVMLMGLTGHFYNVFIISIIIGKYLSAATKSS